jgi:HK97 family phage major capsid protein
MRANRPLFLVFAVALTVLAGFAVGAPDLLHHAAGVVFGHDASGMSLAWGAGVLVLQRQHAEAVKAMVDLNAKAEGENRDFTAEEQTAFDKHKADAASLKVRIERAQQLELASAGLSQEPVAAAPAAAPAAPAGRGQGAVIVPASAVITIAENVDNDPNRGFRSLGEYARAVHGAWRVNKQGTGTQDPRLAALMGPSGPSAAAPSTFGGEGAGADGGFLIPPGFSSNVFTLSLAEDSLLPYTDQMPIEGNSMQIPKDETTPWGSNGVRAYWQAEATAGQGTKPALGMMDLRLKKLLALTPVSDELLGDATALGAYLPEKMAVSIRWKTNEAILFGSGAGVPIGALTALPNSQGAMVVVPKDASQATNTLSVTNLLNMFARLPPGSYSKAVWLINNSVIPALGSLTLGNYPIFLPVSAPSAGGAIQPAMQWTLLGRPVIITQHAKAFSSQGDVTLLDLSYYQTITKSEGIQTATSMHLYFDADAMAFRVTFRVDGQPKLMAPITPANGSNTLSPFLQLQAR